MNVYKYFLSLKTNKGLIPTKLAKLIKSDQFLIRARKNANTKLPFFFSLPQTFAARETKNHNQLNSHLRFSPP